LDEHFPARLAEALRAAGFDVEAVIEHPELTGGTDPEIYQATLELGRRLVTENVRDFRPLLAQALAEGGAATPMLFTTARRHPQNRPAVGALEDALKAWLEDPRPKAPEEWL
jgi:hypothetical protein